MDFLAKFSVGFSVDFAWNRRQISLENFPKPCKTKDLTQRDLFKTNPQEIPAQILPAHSLAIFTETRVSQGIPQWEPFARLNRRENRRLLALFDRKEIAHLVGP